MEILEFGNKNKDKIILIHGLECPYQIWEDYINYYKDNYHIIVPILPGHNPKTKEEFISFDETVQELEEYYISQNGNKVYLVYGMSMGGVVAAKLLENKKINIEKIILESAPLLSYNKVISFILTKLYLILTHQTKKGNKKTIKYALSTIVPKNKLNEFLEVINSISDTTIINYVKQIGIYKLPKNINTVSTKIYYCYGTKINELFSKNTAKYIKKNYPNSNIICNKGKGHCEDLLMNSDVMIKKLNKILGKQYE